MVVENSDLSLLIDLLMPTIIVATHMMEKNLLRPSTSGSADLHTSNCNKNSEKKICTPQLYNHPLGGSKKKATEKKGV